MFNTLRPTLYALRSIETTMPAIASLEDLKAAQEGFGDEVDTPCNLRLALHDSR
jgi:hypothetical protein